MRALHRTTATLAAATLLLAGCAGGSLAPSSTTHSGPAGEDIVATRSVTVDGTVMKVSVHPIVRVGSHAVLTLDLLMPADHPGHSVLVSDVFEGGLPNGPIGPGAVRLIDFAANILYTPAFDAENDIVTNAVDVWNGPEPGVPYRMQIAYAAPGAGHVALLLPGADLVDAVPVIAAGIPAAEVPAKGTKGAKGTKATKRSAGSPSPTPSPSRRAPLNLGAVATAEKHPLESFTEQIDAGVRTAESTDKVTIALGSDVLFASDSADLTPLAQGAIDIAVGQLRSRGAGTVSVVGHTDSEADAAHNQDLSERRAAAVAAALGATLDSAHYPVEASGKGENAPIADNSTEAGRQLNRRVELTLTTARTTAATVTDTAALPPAPALVGTGAQGVSVDDTRRYTFRAPRARLVDGHIVVAFEVTATDDKVDSAFGPAYFSGPDGRDGASSPTVRDMGGVWILQGHTAVHPLDYPLPYIGRTNHMCACELDTYGRIDGGQTRTFTIVYPAIGTPATITLQVESGPTEDHFRLTDIPVKKS